MLVCRFDPIVDMCKTLVPDGFIYLRAQPDTCMNRMMKRSRNEETGVGIDYLQDLHQRHEDWLYSELSVGDKKHRSAHVQPSKPLSSCLGSAKDALPAEESIFGSG